MIKLKSLLKESLLNELEFGTQKAFDSYQKQHDLRGDTEVTVAGKKMSVNQAVKQSKDASVKGNPVFGNNKGGEVFGKSKAKEKKSEPTTYRDVYKPIKSTFEKMGFKGGANEYGDIKYKKNYLMATICLLKLHLLKMKIRIILIQKLVIMILKPLILNLVYGNLKLKVHYLD